MTVSHDEASAVEIPTSPTKDLENDACPTCSRTKSLVRGDAINEIVRLNVGGTRYEVSRDTLKRCEGSMLTSLLSGKWKEGEGGNEIFIDRDGRRFGYILDYLRSNRVYLPDLSDQSALKDEFEYFGIDADMSKVSVKDDFETIGELVDEIKEHEATIEQKKKKIAAIKESYRLANEFSRHAETQGLYLRLNLANNVDKEVLRGCLQSRGLHVVTYGNDESGGKEYVDICTIGRKAKYEKKDDQSGD